MCIVFYRGLFVLEAKYTVMVILSAMDSSHLEKNTFLAVTQRVCVGPNDFEWTTWHPTLPVCILEEYSG